MNSLNDIIDIYIKRIPDKIKQAEALEDATLYYNKLKTINPLDNLEIEVLIYIVDKYSKHTKSKYGWGN